MTEITLHGARPPGAPHPRLGYAMVTTASALFAVNGTVSKLILTGSEITSLRLTELRATGAFAGRVDGGNVAHPHGLAIELNGNLWVADGASGRVVVLTPQGNVKQTIAIKLADGRRGAPSDVALSGRDIYVLATPMGS